MILLLFKGPPSSHSPQLFPILFGLELPCVVQTSRQGKRPWFSRVFCDIGQGWRGEAQQTCSRYSPSSILGRPLLQLFPTSRRHVIYSLHHSLAITSTTIVATQTAGMTGESSPETESENKDEDEKEKRKGINFEHYSTGAQSRKVRRSLRCGLPRIVLCPCFFN